MKHDMKEGKLRSFAVSVMSAVAVAAGLLLIRGHRHEELEQSLDNVVPAGETIPGTISLERLRELGI